MRVLGAEESLTGPSGAAVTIGVYDGVHRGHQWLLARLREAAGPDVPLVVVTFEPHPLSVIRPVSAPKTLTSLARKIDALDALGVDACMVVRFDASRREQSAASFVTETLVDRLHAATVMVGSGFRFGRDREGDLPLLRALGERHGFVVQAAPLLPASRSFNAPVCSSTYIRGLVRQGDVGAASRLLGRPHRADGTVAGISRPRTGRGVPTVVVRADRGAALPVEGSFLGALSFPDGRRHIAGLSIRQGVVVGDRALIDAHLSGEFGCEIGAAVVVELIRPLWASGRDDLAAQACSRAEDLSWASAAEGWAAVT